jgi:DNA-binding NtrC family response regulator
MVLNQDVPRAGTLEQVEALEKKLILNALQQANWVRTKTAVILGIKRSTLNYKMEKHGIASPEDNSTE